MFRVTVSFLLAALLAACAGSRGSARPATPTTATTAATTASSTKSAWVFSPAWEDRFADELVEAIEDDPALADAGERFFGALGSRPEVAAAGERFVALLTQDLAFVSFVATFLGEHGEEGAAALDAHIDQAMERPELDGALDRVLDELFARPAIDAQLERFAATLVDDARLGERLDSALRGAAWRAEAERRFGPMDDAAFGERAGRVLAERERELLDLLVARMTADGRLGAALTAILSDPKFVELTARHLGPLLDSAPFQAAAIPCLVAVLGGEARDALEASLRAALLLPEVEDAVTRWVSQLPSLPSYRGLVSLVGAVAEDPELVGAIGRLLLD